MEHLKIDATVESDIASSFTARFTSHGGEVLQLRWHPAHDVLRMGSTIHSTGCTARLHR